jgi:O-antigen/teichoic acid export membrane protein
MTVQARETGRVGDRLANSAVLLWVTTMVMRGQQIVTTTILARLLDPSDYGVMAMAVVITEFLDLLSNIQVGSAIIRIQELDKKHLDTAFTLNVIRGLLSAAVIFLIARPAAAFMHDPRLADVLYVLMIPAVLGGIHNPHFILYSRDLDFSRDARRSAIAMFTGGVVAVIVAFVYHSYWALVANAITGSLLYAGLSYWRVPGRPALSLAKSRDLLGFGSWIVLINMLDYVNFKLEYLLIGNRIGGSALGAYNFGSQLTSQATKDVAISLSRALLPAFSIISADMERLRTRYGEVQSITLALALPIGVGMSALAANTVLLLVGHKWQLAVPVVEFCAPIFALQTITSSIESLAFALNKGRLIFIRTVVFLVIRSGLMVGGLVLGGFMGIIYARFVAGIFQFVYSMFLVSRLTGARVWDPLIASWRTFAAAAAMWVALTRLPFPDVTALAVLPLAGWLIVKILLGIAVYVGLHLALWVAAGRPDGAESRLGSQASRLAGKFNRRRLA